MPDSYSKFVILDHLYYTWIKLFLKKKVFVNEWRTRLVLLHPQTTIQTKFHQNFICCCGLTSKLNFTEVIFIPSGRHLYIYFTHTVMFISRTSHCFRVMQFNSDFYCHLSLFSVAMKTKWTPLFIANAVEFFDGALTDSFSSHVMGS